MAEHHEMPVCVDVGGFVMLEFLPLLHLCSIKPLVGKFAGKLEWSVPHQWNCFCGFVTSFDPLSDPQCSATFSLCAGMPFSVD